MSNSTKSTIKNTASFYLQFWPVIAALLSGLIYEVRTVDSLTVKVTLLQEELNRMDSKLDSVLLGRKNMAVSYRVTEDTK